MAISTIEQCSLWTNFDAIAALRAIQPTAVSSDDYICSAIARFDGLLAHPFITYPRATLAEDAALGIVGNHRRKIFLRLGIFLFDKTLFQIAPIESQFLQLAFAAAIAYGTIEGVVCE